MEREKEVFEGRELSCVNKKFKCEGEEVGGVGSALFFFTFMGAFNSGL